MTFVYQIADSNRAEPYKPGHSAGPAVAPLTPDGLLLFRRGTTGLDHSLRSDVDQQL